MIRWPVTGKAPALIGIAVGLLAACLVLSRAGGNRPAIPSPGPMFSECDGTIRSIILQYITGADFAIPIYREMLAQLPADVTVYVACPHESFAELRAALGPFADRIAPIFIDHPMTPWSRDRWVALAPARIGGTVTLLASVQENGADIWPARQGDEKIASDIARKLSPAVTSDRPGLYFDGGDFLADSDSVFVAPGAIHRNVQHTAQTRDDLKRQIQNWLHLTPILLDDAPDHHVGMYLMAAGNHRVIVGSPALAKPLLAPIDLPGGPDFTAETQEKFDSVARAALSAGYQVTRIPSVSAVDGKTYVTYLNGIIDERNGRRTIYLPQYKDQDALNKAGKEVWESLGYSTVPIDVTSAFRYFGTLHCLVNVLRKD